MCSEQNRLGSIDKWKDAGEFLFEQLIGALPCFCEDWWGRWGIDVKSDLKGKVVEKLEND